MRAGKGNIYFTNPQQAWIICSDYTDIYICTHIITMKIPKYQHEYRAVIKRLCGQVSGPNIHGATTWKRFIVHRNIWRSSDDAIFPYETLWKELCVGCVSWGELYKITYLCCLLSCTETTCSVFSPALMPRGWFVPLLKLDRHWDLLRQ